MFPLLSFLMTIMRSVGTRVFSFEKSPRLIIDGSFWLFLLTKGKPAFGGYCVPRGERATNLNIVTFTVEDVYLFFFISEPMCVTVALLVHINKKDVTLMYDM